MAEDTIFALASAQGKAGVAVIRVSGPLSFAAGCKLTGNSVPAGGRALRHLRDEQNRHLDQALVLGFSGPASFTGEDVVEFHLHGSVASVNAVLSELSRHDGLRLAEPGEFTRRALENGKMDLTQVEGLADLIDSETESQRQQALRILAGELGKLSKSWRTKLIRAASLIEATIDFADEDVPVDVSHEVSDLISDVLGDLDRQSGGVAMAERIRTGYEVAIVGAPNVGKSTLLNTLAGRDAAITSEFAGTTRDVIEVRMDLSGLPVTLLDTAGLRETSDQIESIGIDRARSRAEQADLRVFLLEDGVRPDFPMQPGDLVYRAKADLLPEQDGAVSGLTGAGVDSLVRDIVGILQNRAAGAGLATRERHRFAIEKSAESLRAVLGLLVDGPDRYDIAAAELRMAVTALDSLVGRVDVEDLLDEIFASFCLGK